MTPANAPNRTEGMSRESITPATARPPRRFPPIPATSDATATNPIQSPSEDTSIARHRREKDGWVRRSLNVAGLVPRSAAISSAAVAAIGVKPRWLPRVSRGAPSPRARGCSASLRALRPGAVRPLAVRLRPRLRDQGERLLLGQLLSLGVPRTRARDAACRPSTGLHHHAAALRAGLRQRLLVQRELTVGVALAREEGAEAARALDQLALAALGAGDPRARRRILLDVGALRIARAADERAVPTGALLERPSALRTRLVEQDGRRAGSVALERARVLALGVVATPDELAIAPELLLQMRRLPALHGAERAELGEDDDRRRDLVLRVLDPLVERVVELTKHAHPLRLSLRDVVELLLHLRRETDVDDVGEEIDEHVDDDHTDLLGEEPLVLQANVATVEQRRDRRRVR